MTEWKIKQLAIHQTTIKKSNPTERGVDVAVYVMKKKNIIATLCHGVKSQDLATHHFYPLGESLLCKWQQDAACDTSTRGVLEVLHPTFMTLILVIQNYWRGAC